MEYVGVLTKIIFSLAMDFTVILGCISLVIFIFLMFAEMVTKRTHKAFFDKIYWLQLSALCMIVPLITTLANH
ncbi:hypothetical protein J2S09_002824 [Bacillus fengqiuensis]|nr:hypothetical protein [Bacillus fengqiuensis]